MKSGEEHRRSQIPSLGIRRIGLQRLCLHVSGTFESIKQNVSSKGIESAGTYKLITISCPT